MNFFNYLQNNFNIPILTFLNDLTQNYYIAIIVRTFADLPIFVIPVFLVIFWLYYAYKKNNEGKINLLFIFYSCLLALIISLIIQQIIFIDRPEGYINNANNLILKHLPDASFPSDHSGIGLGFIGGLFFFGYKKIAYYLLPFFLLMLISRIAGGVHWPLDVICGGLIGLFSALVIYKLRNIYIFKIINNLVIKITSFIKL